MLTKINSEPFISFLSGLSHVVILKTRKTISHYEKGMLIISIDVDVGSKELGLINEGKNDRNVSSRFSEFTVGEMEEIAVPQFVKLLDRYSIPVTLAIRGQLTEVTESILPRLLNSTVQHDIGAHGYSHRKFGSLTPDEAEAELSQISVGMKKLGLFPKSFIFPKNSVDHLKILEKYGYECYRDYGGLSRDDAYIKKTGKLWEVHPSLAIDRYTKVYFMKELLNLAIKRRSPIHLWFHMRDFGIDPSEIKKNSERIFIPFFDYVTSKQREGVLTVETMLSASRKAGAFEEMCQS